MKTKRLVFLVLKIAIAVVLMAWLFHKVDVKSVWGRVASAKPLPVLIGLIFCWTGVAIAGLRWHWLLKAFGINVAIRTAVGIAQIGQFFLIFLPGPAGDDVTRILYISRLSQGHIAESSATVLLDRCIGLASILFLAFLCIPFHWALLASSPQTYWMAVGILSGGALVVAVAAVYFLASGRFMLKWISAIFSALPQWKIVGQLLRIFAYIFENKAVIARVAGVAVGTQALLCVVYWLSGCAVGLTVPLHVWLGFVPILLVANALPITIAGIGVREYLLVTFLGVLAGVGEEEALAASFVAFFIMLVICLLGGIVYVFYRPSATETANPV